MRVIICGSRHWTDRGAIKDRLEKLPSDTVILEGGAAGADTLAREAALALGLAVLTVRADWKRHGLAAGPIRNQQMLDLGACRVIAFHEDLSSSKGTRDMVGRARRAGLEVEVIS